MLSGLLIQPRRFAAVYADVGTGDVFCVVGGEEGVELAYLFRLGVALHRDALVDLGEHLFGVFRLLHRRENVAGTDAVHTHGGSEFQRHAFRKQDDSGLRCVVVGVPTMPFGTVRGGGHEDDAALLPGHAARRFARAEEHPIEVYVYYLLPLFVGDIDKIGPDAYAGVGDEDVNAAEFAVHLPLC